jgi:hypothetical protein
VDNGRDISLPWVCIMNQNLSQLFFYYADNGKVYASEESNGLKVFSSDYSSSWAP